MEKYFLTNDDYSHFENSSFEEKKSTYFGRQKKHIKIIIKILLKMEFL